MPKSALSLKVRTKRELKYRKNPARSPKQRSKAAISRGIETDFKCKSHIAILKKRIMTQSRRQSHAIDNTCPRQVAKPRQKLSILFKGHATTSLSVASRLVRIASDRSSARHQQTRLSTSTNSGPKRRFGPFASLCLDAREIPSWPIKCLLMPHTLRRRGLLYYAATELRNLTTSHSIADNFVETSI